ncbi:MAG: phosphatidylserine/phosphatidylglycerophosphate/cardiolipin synthase family protein [Candidatus Woesearchaeota archaeon]|jgi:cardiolipin synthase
MRRKISSDDLLKYKTFKDQKDFFNCIIQDIKNAKKYIYIETFRFSGGITGKEVRDELIKKAKEGVEIKLLIDHWGSMVKREFFSELLEHKAELIFFRKFKITSNFVKYNNRRDHRKIIVIDDKIVYIGSSNITEHSLDWREFNLRIVGLIAGIFKDIFLDNCKLYNDYFHDKRSHIFPLTYGSFEIVRDVPSLKYRMIRRKLMELIYSAKKEILLETPYFVPDYLFIHALNLAAKRGVKITLIIPKDSDSKVVDMMTSSYLGALHKKNVHVKYYAKHFLHAKVAIIDNVATTGSANLDHRSFSYMYEINLFSNNKKFRDILRKHIDETLKDAEDFNYEIWRRRSILRKICEVLLRPFRTFM